MTSRVAAYAADRSRLLTRDEFDVAVAERMGAMRSSGDESRMTDALRTELDGRWAGYEADPTNVFTWEQVEAELDVDE